jgi:tungstate transport system ATP-binding protein
MYKLDGIRKRYNGRLVLDIDDLEVHPGELLTIIGPNGAGKSTLLRLLHFLEGPDEGVIHYDGEEIYYPVPLELRRRIAMVFQRATLFNRSVRDNIAYGLKVRGLKERGRVDAVMEQLDLIGLASENARALSGGEAQRVTLAQALVLDPQVLLLDEPTANLDPYNAGLIEAIIQAARENGTPTIILVSHHVTQALRLADRVAVIFGGKITELEDAEDFVQKSKDPRTKAFIEGRIPY